MVFVSLMAEAGYLSALDLARVARLDVTTVRGYRRGDHGFRNRKPAACTVLRLARVLHCTEDDVRAAVAASQAARLRRDAELASLRAAVEVNRAERARREAIGLPEDDLEALEARSRSRRRQRDVLERALAATLPSEDARR